MIWRLTYTSAERGPTGRSGFQFVGMTPGTPSGVVGAVTPYMAYRPPPGAPSAPGPDELVGFPTALTYGRADGYTVLAHCRYTGRDYSGRYGNFLGQAVVATPEEMEGLRPIEFWDSPLWDSPLQDPPLGDSPGSDGPAPEDAAPAVLAPGTAFDPDSLLDRLGGDRAHDRLAAILDAVATVVDAGHGRVVLVAEDTEAVARWIAAVSYSLPAELAADLSFTTYAADLETAPHVIVGTVPSACPEGGFRLDEPFSPNGARPGRFARVITDCWRTGDLDGIDAVGELISETPAPVRDPGGPGRPAGGEVPAPEDTAARSSRSPGRPPDGGVSAPGTAAARNPGPPDQVAAGGVPAPETAAARHPGPPHLPPAGGVAAPEDAARDARRPGRAAGAPRSTARRRCSRCAGGTRPSPQGSSRSAPG
ncbi:GAP1-N2 domain-containing protein [Actinoallomurus spadix]|uniref:GAP1-N2 domain-containing protein n=1 Tax=Actinoallomurus spadix TaxID=79912 RepID=UPI0025B08D78|nr:hypothetical protein [Actinoallomurus spadix]